MKKTKLTLMTTAAAAVLGLATLASAQTMQTPSSGGAKPQGGAASGAAGGTVEQKGEPGGALKYQGEQPADKAGSTDKSIGKTTGGQAQSTQPNAAKPDQKMGQSQKPEAAPQRGAQNEHGQDSKMQKGAQQENSKENGKTGVNAATTANPGKSGASVQLSQDQRSRIGTMIGKGSSARVTTKENIDISVGARVPSDVHVTVLPADVVEVVPQYEGFDYIVVGDQILIIDPNDMEIVAVIEA